jgi:hypothetical protein
LDNLGIDTGAEAQAALEVLENVKLSPPATKADVATARAASDVLFDLLTALQDPDAAKQKAATDRLIAIVTELEKNKSVVPFLVASGISSKEADGKKLRLGLINVRRALRSLDPPNFDLLNQVDAIIVQ